MINAYFDESSENDSRKGVLSVSGYALDLSGVDALIAEWQRMLRCFRLPFFHMNECNAHNGVFKHLCEDECDQCAREAIRIARTYPLHGHSFVLTQSEYREIFQDQGFDCDPYTFLVWSVFIHVNRWVHENAPEKRISLFFERGYKTQARANELLQIVSQDRLRGKKNNVASHSFVRKEDSEPTQAADLIAWHVRKGYENVRYGKPIRKDTIALLEDRRVLTINFTPDLLEEIADDYTRKAGTLKNASKIIFSSNLLGPS